MSINKLSAEGRTMIEGRSTDYSTTLGHRHKKILYLDPTNTKLVVRPKKRSISAKKMAAERPTAAQIILFSLKKTTNGRASF